MAVLVDSFLESVKRLVTVPANQSLMDDYALLAMADEATQSFVVPLFLSLRQEYFVTTYDQAITSGTSVYAIPTRSIMRTLRELKYVQTGGNTRNLVQLAIEDVQLFPTEATTSGYYFRGDRIVLTPTPNESTSTLQIWYYLQPSKLVFPTDAALVTSIVGDIVTVSSVPSTFMAGSVVDFVQGISGNSNLGMDKVVSSISGTQITFSTGDVPTDLIAGDYIALAGETPVVQIPPEGIPYLTTKACSRILNAVGDFDGMAKLEEIASQQEKAIKIMAEPRNTGESAKIVPRFGLLRRGRTMFRRGYYGV